MLELTIQRSGFKGAVLRNGSRAAVSKSDWLKKCKSSKDSLSAFCNVNASGLLQKEVVEVVVRRYLINSLYSLLLRLCS